MAYGEFSVRTRQENIHQLAHQVVDVLVIGGGITGAGIARDAALRGLRVGLVEKGDFASGTSSKTARMVHGGLRYLQHYQLLLVHQSCTERDILRRVAPRLVRPIPFVYPVYRHEDNSLTKLSLGLTLYDALVLFRTVKPHRILKPAEFEELEPTVRRDELTGAARYYDCMTDDARFTLLVTRSAHETGAWVANYLEARELIKVDGRVQGVRARDHLTGQDVDIRARIVVNSTGVWVDTLREADDPKYQNMIRANRGTHIVLPLNRVNIHHAIAFMGADGHRAMYAVPWGNTCIVGTTDVDHQGSLDQVAASAQEVNFILTSVSRLFPEAQLGPADILSTYAGLRPLIGDSDEDAYSLSREHQIIESASGLISIAGGKLTTHRAMSEDLVDRIFRRLEAEWNIHIKRPCQTKTAPLAPWLPARVYDEMERLGVIAGVDPAAVTRLRSVYGLGTFQMLRLIQSQPDLGRPITGELPYLQVEIPYILQREMAVHLNDLLMRRMHLIHEAADQGRQAAVQVAQAMGTEYGWSTRQMEQELEQYDRAIALSRAYQHERGQGDSLRLSL